GFVKTYFAERAAAARAFNAKIFDELMHPPMRMESELPNVKARTLVVWGDKDRIIDPSAAQVFASGIPGAQLQIMPNCGHAPMLEYPEESARKLVEFLAGK